MYGGAAGRNSGDPGSFSVVGDVGAGFSRRQPISMVVKKNLPHLLGGSEDQRNL